MMQFFPEVLEGQLQQTKELRQLGSCPNETILWSKVAGFIFITENLILYA